MKIYSLIIGLLVTISSVLGQTTVVLTATEDATINSYYPEENFGSSQTLESYIYSGKYAIRKRSLIKFDISSIPSGSQITSAKIILSGIDHVVQ